MWVLACIPGALWVVTFIGELARDTIAEWRENHPYIGHLNYRDNRPGRYYNTRH